MCTALGTARELTIKGTTFRRIARTGLTRALWGTNREDRGARKDRDGDDNLARVVRGPALDAEVGLVLRCDVHEVAEPVVAGVLGAGETFDGVGPDEYP